MIEAYGERIFTPGRGLVATRVGRYRTPFGIYSGSDHGYIGFPEATAHPLRRLLRTLQ